MFQVWSSALDSSMVSHLTMGQLEALLKELDNAVERICTDYDVK